MSILQGGNWNQGIYVGNLKLSMNYTEDMPIIVKLSTPYGRQQECLRTFIELLSRTQITERSSVHCWNPHAIP